MEDKDEDPPKAPTAQTEIQTDGPSTRQTRGERQLE